MKKFLLFITFIVLGSGLFVNFVTLPKLKEEIQSQYKSIGFETAEIEDIQYQIDGISISKIYLDRNKFSHAENIKLKFFWPLLVLKSEIQSVNVSTLQIVTTPLEIYQEVTTLRSRGINDWPNTKIQNLIIDIATQPNDIRILGRLELGTSQETKTLIGDFSANQEHLSFKGEIKSVIDTNNFTLDSNFSELLLDLYPLKLSRANGWFSFENKENDYDVSAELNAGSGKIFKLPLQSINITVGKQEKNFPVIFRSNISGNQNTTLSADIDFAKQIDNQNFNVLFKSDAFQNLLEYFAQQGLVDADSFKMIDFEKLLLEAQFLKERRFADGPWPFELTASNQNDKTASGVFLLYPDEFNLRGSAQGDVDILEFLNRLINSDDFEGDILRVDENIKNYILKN